MSASWLILIILLLLIGTIWSNVKLLKNTKISDSLLKTIQEKKKKELAEKEIKKPD